MLEHYRKYQGAKTLVGVWDFSRAAFKLGNIFLFNQNLHLLREFTNSQSAEIVSICDVEGDFANQRLRADNYRTYLSHLISCFLLTDTITSFKMFTSRGDFNEYLASIRKKEIPYFPPCAAEAENSFDYKSYLLNKEYFLLRRGITFAKVNQDAMEKAHSFLGHHIGQKVPISVHLYYNSTRRIEGNARLAVWEILFSESLYRHPETSFVLIGNDDLPNSFIEKIRDLPNIIRTQVFGLNILDELAIVQASAAFMGMASGPSNLAILGEKPYLVIKHPGDAWAERFNELEDEGRFVFAGPNQYMKILVESPEILSSFLGNVLCSRSEPANSPHERSRAV